MKKVLIGWIVLIMGIWILWGISDLFIGPWVFFVIGIVLLRKHHRKWGYLFLFLFAITLVCRLLEIEWEWIAVSILLISFGYRLFTNGRVPERQTEERKNGKRPTEHDGTKRTDMFTSGNLRFKTPPFRGSLIDSLYLINQRYELTDINLSSGISDIKMDLSKAMIPEGESTIVISGLLGDVDIYVPDDLDVAVAATVSVGHLDILGHKQGGVNRQVLLETQDYRQARRKVKISISLLAGDVGVRCL
ncbi:cell wall-active antibiotics response protein LiaF [Laceyella putida]|uniref:Cell wall-active antibiotics response protein LiaF n=1 Tax=Laceyella putida TaxID=110101 RepID=A0ABW2RFX2_9BACL